MMMMMMKDFYVRSLKPWKLYIQLYSRLFPSTEYPLQPQIPSNRVCILKTKKFPNTSGLIHFPWQYWLHVAVQNTNTDETKDCPFFRNVVWQLKILHPLLSLSTKFVVLPIIRMPSPFQWAAYTFVRHSIHSEIQPDEKLAEFCNRLTNYM
jgi:hypothetical protein